MSLKKSSLIVLFSLLFFFVVSTVTSVGLIIKSNNSLDNVNKEIQVVLSIIDPINHSRTLRVRVMEYVKMVEAGNSADGAAKLATVKEALTKADHAFAAFMASPRLTDEAPLVSAYQDAWQNYRNQGLAPLIDAGVDVLHPSTRRHYVPAFADSPLSLAGWTRKLWGSPTMLRFSSVRTAANWAMRELLASRPKVSRS